MSKNNDHLDTDGELIITKRLSFAYVVAVLFCFGIVASCVFVYLHFPNFNRYLLGSFAIIFLLLGCIGVLCRKGVIFYKNRQTAATWWSIFGFLVISSKDTGVITRVCSTRVTEDLIRKYSGNIENAFVIQIEFKNKILDVDIRHDLISARHLAKKIARYMDVDLCETSGGLDVLRKAGTLDMSLKERLKAGDLKREYPKKPLLLRIDVETQEKEVSLKMPQMGLNYHTTAIGIFVFPLAYFFSGVTVTAIQSNSYTSAWGQWLAIIFCGTIATTALLFSLQCLLVSLRRDLIVVSPESLTLRRRYLWGVITTTLNSREIEEVEIVYSQYPYYIIQNTEILSVRSDNKIINLGYMLKQPELIWLRDLIQYVLVSGE